MLADFISLSQEIRDGLDSVTKRVLQKRGLSLVKNVYVGYDTEYTLKSYDLHLNKPVSYQIAVNNKFFLKLPKALELKLGKRDVKTDLF